MTVAIVTDSAAAIPPELVELHRIVVVPMWLTVDGMAIREGERELGELLGRRARHDVGADTGRVRQRDPRAARTRAPTRSWCSRSPLR